MFIDTTIARQFIAHYTTITDANIDLDQLASVCKQELIQQDNSENTAEQQTHTYLDNEHFAAIWSKSMGIVTHAAQHISGGAATPADVCSYAWEVLMRSLRKWDKSKHTKFSSYFYGNIQRELFTLTNRKHFRDFYAYNISVDFTNNMWVNTLNDTTLTNGVESIKFVSRQTVKRYLYSLLVKQFHLTKDSLTSTAFLTNLGLTQSSLQELFASVCAHYELVDCLNVENLEASWLTSATLGHLVELIHSFVSSQLNTTKDTVQDSEQFSFTAETCDPVFYQIPYKFGTPEYQVIKTLLECNIDDTKTLAKALGWKKSFLNKVLTNIRTTYPDAQGLV